MKTPKMERNNKLQQEMVSTEYTTINGEGLFALLSMMNAGASRDDIEIQQSVIFDQIKKNKKLN